VNLAGKPSKVGAAVASTAGWLVLLFGGSLALGVGALSGAIFSLGVALALSLPIALVSGGVGFALLHGGKKLRRSGKDAERATREQALLAMAAGGPAPGGRYGVTAPAAARALGLGLEEADGLLTALAKSDPDRLTVDLDDQGTIWFRSLESPPPQGRKVRVDAGASGAAAEGDEVDAGVDEFARSSRR
jgi:hypothetical protein